MARVRLDEHVLSASGTRDVLLEMRAWTLDVATESCVQCVEIPTHRRGTRRPVGHEEDRTPDVHEQEWEVDLMMIKQCDVCEKADTSGEEFGKDDLWLVVVGVGFNTPDLCGFTCLATWATNKAFEEEARQAEYDG